MGGSPGLKQPTSTEQHGAAAPEVSVVGEDEAFRPAGGSGLPARGLLRQLASQRQRGWGRRPRPKRSHRRPRPPRRRPDAGCARVAVTSSASHRELESLAGSVRRRRTTPGSASVHRAVDQLPPLVRARSESASQPSHGKLLPWTPGRLHLQRHRVPPVARGEAQLDLTVAFPVAHCPLPVALPSPPLPRPLSHAHPRAPAKLYALLQSFACSRKALACAGRPTPTTLSRPRFVASASCV